MPAHLSRPIHPFEAMAEPVRRRIVDLLASGESTSGQIAEVIGHEFHVSRTAVSKHLGILRDARFVDVRAELSWRWYRLTSFGIDVLEDAIDDLRMKWDRRIGWDADRLEEFDPLAAPPPYAVVPRRGPGRPGRRGERGRQTEIPPAIEPDLGLFPVPPMTDPPMTSEPTTWEPMTWEPLTESPTAESPMTEPPTTDPPSAWPPLAWPP